MIEHRNETNDLKITNDYGGWMYVGKSGFSLGAVANVKLSVDENSGMLYVAYQDISNNSYITVQKYGDDEIVIHIESGKINGFMSKRAIKMIQNWRKLHKKELLEDWKRAEEKKALSVIKPLE